MNKKTRLCLLIAASFWSILVWWVPNWGNGGQKDAVVVLGYGFIYRDSQDLSRYIKSVADYVCTHQVSIVVLSGGETHQGSGTEAAAMKKELDHYSLPVTVILEEKAQSTKQNMEFSSALLAHYHPKRVVVFGDVVKKPKVLFFAHTYNLARNVSYFGVNFWPKHKNMPF